MNATLLAVGTLALGVTALVALGAFVVHKWLEPMMDVVVGRYVDAPIKHLHDRVAALESDVDELPKRWDDIRGESKRLRDRATYHVRRARAELEQLDLEDPELDALASDLRGRNGEPEQAGELQSVPDLVATVAPEESAIDRALRYKWSKHGL